jgi:uncharacterized Tic20 family protein
MKAEQSPTQDDKIISALAQGAVLLPVWGIIISTLIWITQREKSEYIRDQALQALSWQATQVAIWFVGMACYIASFFLIFGTMFATNPETTAGPPAGFFFPFCVMGLLLLSFLGFIVVGLYAALRNLQGAFFTYPIIGERVRAYINR